jgi:hypothetical protein
VTTEPEQGREQEPPAQPPGRTIARRDLEVVIRRALELSVRDSDAAEDALAEGEVVRIAAELGLEPRHVRQALFELPGMRVAPHWAERYFGSPILASGRAVPTRSDVAMRRLEDYLVTREYLQIVRRRRDQIAFTPAEDTISSIARGLLRPSRRHHLARARRVLLSVRDIDADTAHVSLEADLDEQRRESVRGGLLGGGVVGVVVGSLGALGVDMLAGPGVGATVAQILAFSGGVAASATAGLAAAGAAFRRRMGEARIELEGLLDRVERGERLEPPPAPWRRRLQGRFFGDR